MAASDAQIFLLFLPSFFPFAAVDIVTAVCVVSSHHTCMIRTEYNAIH